MSKPVSHTCHLPQVCTWQSCTTVASTESLLIKGSIPLTCAFRKQCRKAGQKAEDMRQRPAWVRPGKCAAHPWPPLQWDHVSQAQLIAFEAGLRESQSSLSATALVQQPSEQRRTVVWEDQDGNLRQAASHRSQKSQQSHRQLSTAPGSSAALKEQSWTAQGQVGHDVPSKYRAPLASGAQRTSLLQPAMQHSLQGYGAQYQERQPCKAAPPSPCQQYSGKPSAQESIREPFRHESAGRKPRAAAMPSPSKAKEDTGRGGRHKEDRSSPCKAGTSSSPGQLGSSFGYISVSPDRAESPSKAPKGVVTDSRPQHAGKQLCKQQKGQRKRSLSSSPTHMSNWVRWEACDEVVSQLHLLASPVKHFRTA